MKGLISKDLYVVFKLCRAFILLDIIFLAVALLADYNPFYFVYPCILSGMIPITLISYDERESWDKYALTMPFTRAQMVCSKYVIGIIFNAVTLAVYAAALMIKTVNGESFNPGDYFSFIAVLFAASILVPTFSYPVIFKFGAEKGRIFYYVVIGTACAFSILLPKIKLQSFMPITSAGLAAVVCAATILLYTLSWLLSIRFYSRREF